MYGRKDFEIQDGAAITIRPLNKRATAWLLEACEIVDLPYTGGALIIEPELGHDIVGSLENTDFELNIL